MKAHVHMQGLEGAMHLVVWLTIHIRGRLYQKLDGHVVQWPPCADGNEIGWCHEFWGWRNLQCMQMFPGYGQLTPGSMQGLHVILKDQVL